MMLWGTCGVIGMEVDCECGKIVNSKEENYDKTSSERYALGLIMDHDENGHLFPNPIVVSGNPPSSWDWRNAEYNSITGDWNTRIKDQRNCGSCWAFGVIAVLEAVYNIQNENPDLDVDLSEQLVVSCGMTYHPNKIRGCCGGNPLQALDFLKWHGTVSESCFQYKAVDADGRDYGDCDLGDRPSNAPVKCSDKCENWEDEVVKVKNWNSLLNRESMKNAICQYGPIVTGFMVYEDFISYDGGVYEQNSDIEVGGHVVAIVGYDDSQDCWICKNSWGTGWGENGFFRIKYGECRIDDAGGSAYVDGYTKSKVYHRAIFPNFLQNFPIFAKLLDLIYFKNL
jgi:C1A family cysteine protease